MKKVISALLVASSFMLLTACDAGTAAQIGDTKISINTVQSRIAEINAERTKYDTSQMQLSVGEELNRTEVRFLVISEIFKKLAVKSGIKITQAMKDVFAKTEKIQFPTFSTGVSAVPTAFRAPPITATPRKSNVIKSRDDTINMMSSNRPRLLPDGRAISNYS